METDISLDDHPSGHCVIPAFVPSKTFPPSKTPYMMCTWYHLKRFRGTKHIVELTWYRLKRFRGTK